MLNNYIRSLLDFTSGTTHRQKIVNYINKYMLKKYTQECIKKYSKTLRKLANE